MIKKDEEDIIVMFIDKTTFERESISASLPVPRERTQHRLKICKTSIVTLSVYDIWIPFVWVICLVCQLTSLLQVTLLQVIELPQ